MRNHVVTYTKLERNVNFSVKRAEKSPENEVVKTCSAAAELGYTSRIFFLTREGMQWITCVYFSFLIKKSALRGSF